MASRKCQPASLAKKTKKIEKLIPQDIAAVRKKKNISSLNKEEKKKKY